MPDQYCAPVRFHTCCPVRHKQLNDNVPPFDHRKHFLCNWDRVNDVTSHITQMHHTAPHAALMQSPLHTGKQQYVPSLLLHSLMSLLYAVHSFVNKRKKSTEPACPAVIHTAYSSPCRQKAVEYGTGWPHALLGADSCTTTAHVRPAGHLTLHASSPASWPVTATALSFHDSIVVSIMGLIHHLHATPYTHCIARPVTAWQCIYARYASLQV